jgi:hypothetical protein
LRSWSPDLGRRVHARPHRNDRSSLSEGRSPRIRTWIPVSSVLRDPSTIPDYVAPLLQVAELLGR